MPGCLYTHAPALLTVTLLGACSASSTHSETPPPPSTPADSPVASPDPAAEPKAGDGDQGELVMSDAPCETDADCVPATCCHPASCVGVDDAPDCSDVMCTEECQFGTLDCGGACLCHEGRCAARLSQAPDIP